MSKAWEPQLALRVGCLRATANKTKLRNRTVPGKRLATVSGKELKTRISILSRISSLGAAPTWGEGVENYGGEEALSVRVPAESQSCRWDLTGSGMQHLTQSGAYQQCSRACFEKYDVLLHKWLLLQTHIRRAHGDAFLCGMAE